MPRSVSWLTARSSTMLDLLSEQCLKDSCRDSRQGPPGLDRYQLTYSSYILGPGYPAHNGSYQQSRVSGNRSGVRGRLDRFHQGRGHGGVREGLHRQQGDFR